MTHLSALSNQKIIIVGLGQEGAALALYLVKHGLKPVVTDAASAEQIGPIVADLEKAGLTCVLGEHPISLLDEADVLFVSPGVPLTIPLLKEAKSRGIPLTTETKLFCHLCPAPIVAITGSSGKSTTTTLVGKMVEASGKRTWVGGNIGRPLIDVVDEIRADDVVVMELSSFQLDYFRGQLNKRANPGQVGPLIAAWSPSISAILNITPNHLDRHGGMRSYVSAKRAIIEAQSADGVAIMSLDNDVTRTIGRQLHDRVRWFSLEAERPNGACIYQEQLTLLDPSGGREAIIGIDEVKLLGQHNLSNALAACLMAREAGVSTETMRAVLQEFAGLSYRLEHIRTHNQIDYYNDSIATSPARLTVALRAFERPIVLLAGGRDKKLSWEEVSRFIVHKTEHLILFGEAQAMIAEVVEKAAQAVNKQTTIHYCQDLTAGMEIAVQVARPNDIVLLSPGCASYDQFHNFVERGDRFNELVQTL